MKRIAAVILAVGLAASPALGGHGNDLHSDTMSLVGRYDEAGAYRQGTDLAFWGDTMVAGSFDNPGGFRLLDVSNPPRPRLIGRFPCQGSQGDVSIWENLVFVSVDSGMRGGACGGGASSADERLLGESWEGLRVVSIANPAKPVQVAAVQTDCGSHTHTLVPDLPRGRILVYVGSYPAGRQGSSCNLHFKISIVEVPLARPQDARVVATPSVQPALGCHDVTVFLPRRLAAAACLTQTQLWDITDPVAPRILGQITNPRINIHHSTTLSWDGDTVVIGDELGGAIVSPGCLSGGAVPFGSLWFYDVSDPAAPQERGRFAVPRNETTILCTAHNFLPIPMRGRDVLVSAWYNGGTTVVDFTDPSSPTEIGHYLPRDGARASAWSSYWYNGFVYVNNFDEGFVVGGGRSRGIDVLRLTESRVAAAVKLPRQNAQTMEGLPAQPAAPPAPRRPAKVLQTRRLPATGVAGTVPAGLAILGAAGAGLVALLRRDRFH